MEDSPNLRNSFKICKKAISRLIFSKHSRDQDIRGSLAEYNNLRTYISV